MGVLRYSALPNKGIHSYSSQSVPQFPSPWKIGPYLQRVKRSRPLKPPSCALETSSGEQSGGLTKTNTELGAPSSASASTLQGIEEGWEVTKLAPDVDPLSITEWELDFCSRPILDIRGKKIWELVVCDSRRDLEFTRFYPNNVINSITLKNAIMSIIQTLGVPKPERIRFFRSQMQTIVSKACTELEIKPIASKRCLSLVQLLEERYEPVYMRHPGFQEGAKPLLSIEQPFPLDLPDNLYGEKWAFVQLPLAAIQEEMEIVEEGSAFGSVLDLDVLGIELSDDTLIPGVSVATSRAIALAGSPYAKKPEVEKVAKVVTDVRFDNVSEPLVRVLEMVDGDKKPMGYLYEANNSYFFDNTSFTNSLEIASIDVDRQRACLVLSAGVSKRWRYAFYKKSKQTDQEAEAWEAAKRACGGLHFLAIQESLDSDSCTGFWLILDMPSPPV